MKSIMDSKKENKYYAFISYSRKDKKVANWLHVQLEKYEYPKDLINIELQPFHKKYVRPIFLDTKDMQVEKRPFTDRIQYALANSRFLLLISSRNATKSQFVEQEITYFLNTHDNNYSLIIPLFIDDVTDDSIPNVIKGTSIMERHFPIYNTLLSEESEANKYCLYQIVAYMLGVNFSDIYNRYEVYTSMKRRRVRKRFGFLIMSLCLIVASLGLALYQGLKVVEKGEELVQFERNVFPAAVVFGYEENFLRPVINHLKEETENFCVYVFMPTSNRELRHKDRIIDINHYLKQELDIDSICVECLHTTAKRGSTVYRLAKSGKYIPSVYIDFASTTTSFFKIAEYKMKHPEYQSYSIDDIIYDYTTSFIELTNKELKNDSIYLKFITDKEVLVKNIVNMSKLGNK